MCDKPEETLQDIHPETILLLAELLGNVMPLNMPFNVQNLLGNWLQLIGQAILVFNAQQQLWENGLGQYYRCNHKHYNDNIGIRAERQVILQEIAQLRARLERLERML